VIGGLALVCGMGIPHRATTDLDVANRRRVTKQKRLELLITGTISYHWDWAGPASERCARPNAVGMFRSM
jgi:hypothetical protein